MKRPLIWITVGYITGIIWGLYLKTSIAFIFLLVGGISILFIKTGIIELKRISKYRGLIISFLIVSVIANIHISYLENKHKNLYREIQEKDETIEVIGTVITDEKETTYKKNYTIKVESIDGDKKFQGTNLIVYTSKETTLRYGNKIRFKGTYEEAKRGTNYQAFDYQEYLKTKNVYGIVNAKLKPDILKEKNLNPFLIVINGIQKKIKSNLDEILGERAIVVYIIF